MAPLTTAERQARYRQRLKDQAAHGVTPDEINRARRILYEREASDPLNRLEPWEDWVALCRQRKHRERWRSFLPESGDIVDWVDYGDDAALLAKVGAIVEAINKVPD